MVGGGGDFWNVCCHSPHGECGLKFPSGHGTAQGLWSFSSRRMWIEMQPSGGVPIKATSHSPHGECGLKFSAVHHSLCPPRHSPHGECGLKLPTTSDTYPTIPSFSSRRMWIEIPGWTLQSQSIPSFSSRRMWIEILRAGSISNSYDVILLTENVD